MQIRPQLFRAAVWIGALHGVVSVLHGLAHLGAAVPLSISDGVFVIVVVFGVPFLGLALMAARRVQSGAALYLIGMGGALLFGVQHHFLMPGLDNVASVGADGWGYTFQVTAAGLSVFEAMGTVIGLALLWRVREQWSLR